MPRLPDASDVPVVSPDVLRDTGPAVPSNFGGAAVAAGAEQLAQAGEEAAFELLEAEASADAAAASNAAASELQSLKIDYTERFGTFGGIEKMQQQYDTDAAEIRARHGEGLSTVSGTLYRTDFDKRAITTRGTLLEGNRVFIVKAGIDALDAAAVDLAKDFNDPALTADKDSFDFVIAEYDARLVNGVFSGHITQGDALERKAEFLDVAIQAALDNHLAESDPSDAFDQFKGGVFVDDNGEPTFEQELWDKLSPEKRQDVRDRAFKLLADQNRLERAAEDARDDAIEEQKDELKLKIYEARTPEEAREAFVELFDLGMTDAELRYWGDLQANGTGGANQDRTDVEVRWVVEIETNPDLTLSDLTAGMRGELKRETQLRIIEEWKARRDSTDSALVQRIRAEFGFSSDTADMLRDEVAREQWRQVSQLVSQYLHWKLQPENASASTGQRITEVDRILVTSGRETRDRLVGQQRTDLISRGLPAELAGGNNYDAMKAWIADTDNVPIELQDGMKQKVNRLSNLLGGGG